MISYKRCLSTLLASSILISLFAIPSVSVCAAESMQAYSGNGVIEAQGSISGAANKNYIMAVRSDSDASITDGNIDDIIIGWEQSVTDNDGGFLAVIPIAADIPSGYYRVELTLAGSDEINASSDCYYMSSADAASLLQQFKNASGTGEINSFIDTNEEILSIDKSAIYQGLKVKSKVYEKMLYQKGINRYTAVSDIAKSFNESCILEKLAEADGENEYLNVLNSYQTSLGIDLSALNSFDSPVKVAEILMLTDYSSRQALEDKLPEAICVASFNACSRSDAAELISKYIANLNISSAYGSLGSSARAELYKSLETHTSFKSYLDISAFINNHISSASKGTVSSGGGGTGGSVNTNFQALPQDTQAIQTPQPQTDTEQEGFTDMDTAAWAIPAVDYLAAKGIVAGISQSKFAPNRNITREEFTALLIRAIGIPDSTKALSFKDTDNDEWYAPYIRAALSAGIVNGISDTWFGVGEPITRQDMALMLSNAITSQNIELAQNGSVPDFADKNAISDYAVEAVERLCLCGIMNGVSDTEFAPHANATRAMAAKVLYSVLLPKTSSATVNENVETADFALQVGLLVPDSENNLVLADKVTRAELARIICVTMNYDTGVGTGTGFPDMSSQDALFPYAVTAVSIGIMDAPGGAFRPNEEVSVYELVNAMIGILGYNNIMDEVTKETVWQKAAELGLMKGASLKPDMILTKGAAAIICYNAFNTDMVLWDTNGGNTSYTTSKDATIFTEYWDAKKSKGIITENNRTGLSWSTHYMNDMVVINDIGYAVGNTHADELLGYYVEYYYSEEENELIYVRPTSRNNTMRIKASELDKFMSDYTIKYFKTEDSSRSTSVRVSPEADIIYNDSSYFEFEKDGGFSALVPKTGYIDLIDNNADGRYDVVKIYEYKNYFVGGINREDKQIRDKIRSRLVDLDENEIDRLEINIWNENTQSAFPGDFSDISKGNTISVFADKDGNGVYAVVNNGFISGNITAYSQKRNTIAIGEEVFDISADYIRELDLGNANIKIPETGEEATVYFDYCNEISYIETDNTSKQYAFLDHIYLDNAGEKLGFKMYTEADMWERIPAADKVKVNGTVYKSNQEAYQALGGESFYSDVVRYTLNLAGELTAVEIAKNMTSASAYLGYDEDNFTKDSILTNATYKSRDKELAHKYTFELGTTTILFISANNRGENGRLIDDEDIFVADAGYFVNDKTYSVEVYDSDKYYMSRVLVITDTKNEPYDYNLLFVNENSEYANSDHEMVYALTGYLNGAVVTYETDDKELVRGINKGDVVKMLIKSDGKTIRRAQKVASINENTKDNSVFTLDTPAINTSNTAYALYSGILYDVDYERSAYMVYTDGIYTMRRFGGNLLKLMIWDSEKEEFRLADINEIDGEKTLGTQQRVFIHDRYNETRAMVVIK
ncbi:MAG: S-layer homology domain-containing protein [Clostridia bacterium]|nr:S-layer homology domain-containing protein [Clostridia bacterium]